MNCSCFSENVRSAVDGRCTEECLLFPLFAVGIVITMLLLFMNNVPMLIASLRYAVFTDFTFGPPSPNFSIFKSTLKICIDHWLQENLIFAIGGTKQPLAVKKSILFGENITLSESLE